MTFGDIIAQTDLRDGIMEPSPVVELSKREFEKLIRQSERLEIIKRMYKQNDFVSDRNIEIVLGVEKENVTNGYDED